MLEYPVVIVPFVMLLIGWMCTKRPTSVIRFITGWLEVPPSGSGALNQSQELAKYVKEHPDTWPEKYPWIYKQVLISGFVAYLFFVIGTFIIILAFLGL